jgi:hypothetical protein
VALLPIPIVIGGLLIWMFAKRFPPPVAGTGTPPRQRLRDLRATPRAHGSAGEQKNIFSEYLPYAVVLGIATKWAKTFEPLGAEAMTGTTAWYIGREPFSSDRFGGISSIWQVDVDDGAVRQLSPYIGNDPCWSPTDRDVLFWGRRVAVSSPGTGQSDVWLARPDGPEPITTIRLPVLTICSAASIAVAFNADRTHFYGSPPPSCRPPEGSREKVRTRSLFRHSG